jgi:hypothetical protein
LAQLRLDALAVCGDARIAVDHAAIMHIYYAQGKPKKIKVVIFVQNS